jgi:hypothetical protein
LPRGTVREVGIYLAPGLRCRVAIRDDFGAEHRVEASQSEIAAALIETCIDRRIPVPRRASKTVEAIEGGIVLVFTLEDGMSAQHPPPRGIAPA